ncbi:MAG: pyruvate, water dikinase [Microgenomates group bacterium Gr01-1014_16]|nr:MAG: pyruvate, water dikinase [Microgenomates group bacterium Gr01-1014_16]
MIIIKGIPGSVGVITGVARVIIDQHHLQAFKSGEILVTKQTSPAWTPIFMAAKAIVTEIGGQLSHAAIVAREYGIPAVVGVPNATKLLKSGIKIEVNGTKGTIQVL